MKQVKDQSLQLSAYLDSRLDEKIIALPLQFQYLPVQIISKQYTKLNSNHPYRIHYLGPRFTNTLVLHKKYSDVNPNKQKNYFQELLAYNKYKVQMRKLIQSNYLNQKLQNNHYYKSSIFYRAFQGMNPTLDLKAEFIFNSCFEAGNLDCVIKVNPMEYDLFLRIDSNTRGHTQWFYFSVQNGNKKGKVTFNICNLTKPKTLYEQGMRPYVYSKKKYEKSGRGWEQQGQNIELIQKKLRYNIVYEMLSHLFVYKLSFDYTFQEEEDQVFFAYSIPYTYSQLLKDIQILPKEYVKKYTLGRSLTGLEIPVLHISNHESAQQKKNIMIIGRAHPGESNGSHLLNGFINFICSNNPTAVQTRNKVNFIIVPMTNPDGVIMGNSRSSASGKDLNRQYLTSKKQLYPEVFSIKNLAFKLHKNQKIFMFFDFHGHSRKKNTFFYGPAYSLSEPDYYKSRALAKMVEKQNPSFRYYSCSFLLSQHKKGTARAVMFQKFKIPYVYTVQSSIGLYYDINRLKTIQFVKEEWQKMGSDICQGVFSFIEAYEEYEQMLAERRKQRHRRREKFKRTGKQKKFLEDFDEDAEGNQQSQTHKKNCLMFDLMQEIKQMPQKNADPDASSDDHDDAEDLQSSKMHEFNNLIIQSKQKDQVQKVNRVVEQSMEEEDFVHKRAETENQEIQLIKELEEKKKMIKSNKNLSLQSTQEVKLPNPNHLIYQKRIFSFHTNATIEIRNSEDKVKNNSLHQNKDWVRSTKKSINFDTHRHLISKQFFPIDRCQIVEFPKSSIGNRKDIKKGRPSIQPFMQDKKPQIERETSSLNSKTPTLVSRSAKTKNLTDYKEVQSSMGKKVKIEDIVQNRALSQKRLLDKKNSFSKGISSSNRVFDSVIFSGLELDNMAMMIRTFNK